MTVCVPKSIRRPEKKNGSMELSDQVTESWLRYEKDIIRRDSGEVAKIEKPIKYTMCATQQRKGHGGMVVDSFVQKHRSVTYAIYTGPWPQVP